MKQDLELMDLYVDSGDHRRDTPLKIVLRLTTPAHRIRTIELTTDQAFKLARQALDAYARVCDDEDRKKGNG